MSTNASLNGDKKRKQDCIIDNEDQPEVKSVKLSEVNNSTEGAEPDGSESDSGSSSQEESLSGVPTSTPGTKSLSLAPLISAPASRNQDGGIPAPLPSTNQQQGLPQPGIPPQQNPWILELHKGTVFEQLLSAFSSDQLPKKITYNGSGYYLHKALEEFWILFYNSDVYAKGNFTKLPKNKGLAELQAIARIVRRGWEDCHYFPNRIFPPFLEACIFNRETLMVQESEGMFFEYIAPSDKEIIENNQESKVTEEMLKVFKKYCTDTGNIKIGDSISVASSKAVKIILRNLKSEIDVWTHELAGLLEFKEFNFIMERHDFKGSVEMKDLEGYEEEAPHNRWSVTFFYGWSQKQIDYYFRALKNDVLSSKCNFCKKTGNFDVQHFLGRCDFSISTSLKDRHDCVIRKIHHELKSAIARKRPYFLEGEWEINVIYGNLRRKWPECLEKLKGTDKYPHIIVYTLSPTKRALIIEISIAWETNINIRKQSKTSAYFIVKQALEESGFQVQCEIIILGSRGVATEDLYSLFEQVFGMSQSETYRAMEKICRKIVSAPYFYNIAMSNSVE